MDSFFNQYSHAVKQIELLIAGLYLFDQKMNQDEMKQAIDNCTDIALLQEYVSQLFDKNANLVFREVNVYNELKSVDPQKADIFFYIIEE